MTIPPDDLMAEVTAGMEGVRIPSEGDAMDVAPTSTVTTEELLSRGGVRPLDIVGGHGAPANPIPFVRPTFERGKRDDVLCYNSTTQCHDVAKNVLFRDYSREYGDEGIHHVDRAYWSVPYKEPIKTIMGHVQICVVLQRCKQDDDDSDSENDGDDDIVFQMTDQFVAIKVNYCDRMEKLKNKHAEDPMKEIAAMQLIGNDHPNVLGCIEVLFDGQNINCVLPFCRDGDLFELLQESQRQPVPGMKEPQARFWFRQVLDGLKHLHSRGICHRDLSPENIMMHESGCLIIDMGMCIRIPYTDPHGDGEKVTDVTRGTEKRLILPQGTCGKLPYMAPEIYKNRHPFDGGAVDIWTAGTILFCMLTGNRSYQRAHATDAQFYWMTHGLTMLLDDWNVTLSPEAVDILVGMLKIDPRERLTLEEVMQHRWLSHPDEPPSM